MDAESGSFTAAMIEHVEGAMEHLEAVQVEVWPGIAKMQGGLECTSMSI